MRMGLKRFLVFLFVAGILSLTGIVSGQMVSMSDDELSKVDGQALIEMQKTTMNGFTFYTVNLDATLKLNANIQSMQLGCNGINGSGNCDLSMSNVSFGCASTDGVNCYTPSTSCSGTICTASTGTPSTLIPFILDNPFLQLAIQNDGTPTLRSLAGIRLGAQSVNGPLSVGSFNSFSGYISGTGSFSMLGTCNSIDNTYCSQGIPVTTNAAVTVSGNSNGCTGGTSTCGGSYEGQPSGSTENYTMGITDNYACFIICAWYHQLAVGFPSQAVQNTSGSASIAVEASGNRISAATVENINFAAAVASLANNLTAKRSTFGCAGFTNAVLPLVIGQITNNIDGQIASGLGISTSTSTTCGGTCIGDANLPYNLQNIHQLTISASNFGLSFENQAIAYPGYKNAAGAVQTVPTGWAMYAANAFSLPVQQPAWIFTNNITNGAAKAGNIIGLPGPYQNCYGSATFC